MPMTPDDWAAYAISVLGIMVDVNREHRMSVQVKGLADTVRRAKAAIDAAGGAATRLESSANAVVNTIGAVDDMTKQLDAANADLQAAVGVMTNGGPPLETTGGLAPISPPAGSPADPANPNVATAVPGETIPTAAAKVDASHIAPADAFPPPPATPVAPTVAVTASTIAAANAAAAASAVTR